MKGLRPLHKEPDSAHRDHLLEAGLDPTELQGKELSCACELTEPCDADVLLEFANACRNMNGARAGELLCLQKPKKPRISCRRTPGTEHRPYIPTSRP